MESPTTSTSIAGGGGGGSFGGAHAAKIDATATSAPAK